MATKPQKKKMNKHLQKTKARNFVSKHSHNMSGAGSHVDKKGEKAPRCRQKKQWKKEIASDY